MLDGGAKTRPFYSRDAFFPTEVKTSSNRAPIVCDKAPLMGSMRDHSIYILGQYTLAKTEIIYQKNVRAKVAMDFT